MIRILLIFINLSILFLLTSQHLFAQQIYYPLGKEIGIAIDRALNKQDAALHTSFKPILKSAVNGSQTVDPYIYPIRDSLLPTKLTHTWLWRKARNEDFVVIDTSNLYLTINPLANLEFDLRQTSGAFWAVNTRAVCAEGTVGKRISFHTSFYENQAYLVDYVNEYALKQIVVPGQGASKPFKESGHDYAMASGYVSMSPTNWFNLQLGHDKNFIGDGYRSLLLSDNAFNYPFAKITTRFGQFQYTNMWAAMYSFTHKNYAQHWRKHTAINYLSWTPHPRLELGLMESVIWQSTDSTFSNQFTPNFFNPIPLFRTLQYKLDYRHNAMVGLTARVKVSDYVQAYGQLMIDDLEKWGSRNKTAYQYGLKITDLFYDKLRYNHLYLQAEHNTVGLYAYSHEIPLQSYTHKNQPLAHPLGSGFSETVLIARYSLADLFCQLTYSKAFTAQDTTGSDFGINPFISDTQASFANEISQIGSGNAATITNMQLKAGLVLNPRTMMQVYAGIHTRVLSTENQNRQTNYVFFGFRTSLINYYYDF